MQYNQPFDQPSNPNAPYIDGNPAAGIQGSIVPAAAVEYDQREVVEVITRANVRGYSDFGGVPCAVPANTDQTQLRKAIEGFITNWQFIISTEVTFKVHGSGADFPNLIAAFEFLGKYRITPNGHVILQCAGAAPGAASATQYVYNAPIIAAHPNNDRISIFGAPMLAPVSRTDAGYAWNGPSAAQRATDTNTNLAILRTKFATEFHFSGNYSTGVGWFPIAGIIILGHCLMHLDGLLFTGDPTQNQGSGMLFMCFGSMNSLPRSSVPGSPWALDGLAVVNFKNGSGFNFDVGSCVSCWGEAPDQNFNTTWISIGNGNGIAVTNGGFITAFGNMICLCNDGSGLYLWPRGGTQWDGGQFNNANGGQGIQCYLSSTGFLACPAGPGGGSGTVPSHLYRNAGYGLWVMMSNTTIMADFGVGANANAGGTIWANHNSGVSIAGPAANYAAGSSPPYGTVGNSNSMIA